MSRINKPLSTPGTVFFLSIIGSWLAFSPLQAREEEGLEEEFQLLEEELVVYSAAKHEQDIAESPSAITVITREQIENTFCTNIACLLSMTPEIEIKHYNPAYTSVSARALTGDYGGILVLVDGREINFDFVGIALWESLPIDLADIERIEILRGPNSALYGANAYSAVISISTRKTTGNSVDIFLLGGEHDQTNLGLRTERLLGDYRFLLSAGHETSGSWEIPRQRVRELDRIRLRLERETSSSTANLELGVLIMPRSTFNLYVTSATFEDTYFSHLLASYKSGHWYGRIWFDLASVNVRPDMPLYLGSIKLGELPDNLHYLITTLDAETQSNWTLFESNLLIGGLNYRWTSSLSQDNSPEEIYQHRIGLFIHDEQRIRESLVLTGSIRFDYNTLTRFTINPRLAAVWRFEQNQFLRLSFGRSFLKPSLFESSTHIKNVKGDIQGIDDFFLKNMGNENIGNENLYSWEAGYVGRFFNKSLLVEGDFFFQQYRNKIDFFTNIVNTPMGVPDLTNSKMRFENNGQDIDSIGGSVSVTYHPVDSLKFAMNYTYRFSRFATDPINTTEVWINQKGDRYSLEPAHLFNFMFHYLPDSGVRFGMGFHGDSSTQYMWSLNGSFFGQKVLIDIPANVYLSGFAAWRFSLSSIWLEAGVRAYNALNSSFRESPGSESPVGSISGAERVGRQISFFLRGSL